jgi:hypothetical protein
LYGGEIMPDDSPTRGLSVLGQLGIAAIAAARPRLPIVAGCFAALIAATIGHKGSGHGQLPAPVKRRSRQRANPIDTASEDSFPASDPPSWTPVSGTGTRH